MRLQRAVAPWCLLLLVSAVPLRAQEANPANGSAPVISPEIKTATILVQDAEGKPIADAAVFVMNFDSLGDATVLQKTDATGRTSYAGASVSPAGLSLGRAAVLKDGYAVGGALLHEGENVVILGQPHAVSGTVKDPNGQPVANTKVGVRLVLTGKEGNWVLLSEPPLASRFESATDAEGRWTISGLPEKSRVSVSIQDDRWVRQDESIVVSAEDEAVGLTARPGAVFEGRLVDENGKPLPDVGIGATGQNALGSYDSKRTDADGRFRLTGLAAGLHNVLVRLNPQSELVAPALEGIVARAGETTALPDIVAGPGAIVTGRVLDDETGKPVSRIQIGTYGPHRPDSTAEVMSAATDEKGEFRLRVAPGSSRFYVMGVRPPYVSDYRPQKLTLRRGETSEIEFRVKAGFAVEGVARDEQGAPLADVRLSLQEVRGDVRQTRTDGEGRFRFEGIGAGEGTISAEKKWAVVGDDKVTLPRQGPLALKLRAVNMVAVAGRVLDSEGKPVSNAEVTLHTTYKSGRNRWWDFETGMQPQRTDAEGRYSWEDLSPENDYRVAVRKEHHRVQKSPEVQIDREIIGINGALIANPRPTIRVSDAVLLPLRGSVAGRVIDGNGEPIANVAVTSPAADGTNPVRSDENGLWTLRDLPEETVTILAADARRFGQIAVPSSQLMSATEKPVAGEREEKKDTSAAGDLHTLTLQPAAVQPVDVEQAFDIARELAPQADANNYNLRSLPVLLAGYDWDAALELRASLPGEMAPLDQAFGLFLNLAKLDPELAREELPPIFAVPGAIEPAQPGMREYQALAMAEFVPEWALGVYQKALPARQPSAAPDWSFVAMRLNLACLAAVLKQPEADELLNEALAAAEKGKFEPQVGSYAAIAEGVARYYPAALERVLAKVPGEELAEAMARAIRYSAKKDLPTARALLARLAESKELPGDNRSFRVGQATLAIVEELVKVDVPAALALAQAVQNNVFRARCLLLVAPHLPPAEAAPLLQTAFDIATDDWDGVVRPTVAATAHRLDPALGSRLFDQLEQDLDKRDAQGRQLADATKLAPLAFYEAPFRPGRVRFLIELGWARLRVAHLQGDQSGDLFGLVRAMAALDATRALEMARDMPPRKNPDGAESYDERWRSMRKIVEYVAASEETRQSIDFSRWRYSDLLSMDD